MADGSVQLIVSSAHAPRIAAVVAWVIDRASRGPVQVIAPTQRAADDLARRAAHAVSGLLGVQRTTALRLAGEWATPVLASAGRTRLSALAAEAMAVRAVHRVVAEAPFEYFQPVQHFSGFARAAARTLLGLRLDEIEPKALADGPRGRDLGRLLAAFDEELVRLRFADTAVVLRSAIEAVEAATPVAKPPFPSTVVVDVVPSSGLERRWLKTVTDRSAAVLLAYANADPAVVGAAPGSIEQTWDVQASTHAEAEAEGFDRALDRARHRIFATGPLDPGAPDASLSFFSAPGEARECVEIARQIRSLAAEGVRFDEVAVLLPRPHAYRSLLEDALRRAGVPMFCTTRARRPLPSGRALLALLACASENLAASRFAEYLSLGQVPRLGQDDPPAEAVPWVAPRDDRQLAFATAPKPAPPPETDDALAPAGHLPTPLRWERLLVDAQVRAGGSARWRRRLEGYAAELRLQLKGLADAQDAERAKRAADLRSLEQLTRFSLPILTALEQLPERAPWSAWLEGLRALAARSLRDPEPVLAVLAELAPMNDVGPVDLEEVRQVLFPRLSFLQEDPTGHRFGKVFVADIDEAAGRAFKMVFLPGLAQGVFPAPIFEDPLLLDDARRRIDEDLAVVPRRRQEERRRLRWALGAATDRLIASYPRIDILQGRPRVPSFYAFDLLRAAYGRVPSLSRFEHEAAAATDSQWGWPAPADPRVALDDGEYDLAVLGPHLLEPAAAVRGRGRYLIDDGRGRPLNAFLVRALSVEARRWRAPWTYADGLVGADDGAVRAAIAAHHPTVRSYSATALQHFSDCPYRFLLQAVHRLRPREPVAPVEDLDPLTRGSLFHEVQFHFLQRVREHAPLTPDRRDEARGWLDEAQTRVADEYRDRLAPSIPAVWSKAMDDMRIDLHGWLAQLLAASPEWHPTHAELAFGLAEPDDGGRDPNSVAEPATILGRYRLRGSIDLVEAEAATGRLRVTDHKTGRAIDRSLVYIGGGRHLQPVLYALAAERLLERPVVGGRLAYCTRRGGYATREVGLDEEAKAAARAVFDAVESAFERAFFVAAPAPGACRYCDYRRVCGPFEEHRVTQKSADGLGDLVALRGRP